jgi:hypothetical protein
MAEDRETQSPADSNRAAELWLSPEEKRQDASFCLPR